MYLAWAAYYEGNTDAAYYDVMVPRVIDTILMVEGAHTTVVPEAPAIRFGKNGRDIRQVAQEICEGQDAFYLLFIHADTGGRSLEANIGHRREAFATAAHELCNWPLDRTVLISPRHETEAWALADPDAVCRSLGYVGAHRDIDLPTSGVAADRLTDPKAKLAQIAEDISGRPYRAHTGLLTSIAQEQSLDALRTSPSFQSFEQNLRAALTGIGCLN